MIKKILCLVLTVVILLMCVGCSNMETVQDTKEDLSNKSMFVLIEGGSLWSRYNIVYHKETRVMYAVGCDAVFTVMLDADGKPLLWKG